MYLFEIISNLGIKALSLQINKKDLHVNNVVFTSLKV